MRSAAKPPDRETRDQATPKESQKPRALYLNGDLFHYLIAHPKFTTASVERVFAKFREVRDRGVAIHYVEGNRDFFLKGSFVENAAFIPWCWR